MTPEQAREAAAVMLAFADGKKIEWIHPDDKDDIWEPCDKPRFDWQQFRYRVAPEPWEGKIWIHPNGSCMTPGFALGYGRMEGEGWRLITVKEVI